MIDPNALRAAGYSEDIVNAYVRDNSRTTAIPLTFTRNEELTKALNEYVVEFLDYPPWPPKGGFLGGVYPYRLKEVK